MSFSTLKNVFAKYDDEYLHFERVEAKRSQRRDIHAYLLLDQLFPSEKPMVAAAEHDVIYLGIDADMLSEVSEETICELRRCGVSYDSDGLWMFV